MKHVTLFLFLVLTLSCLKNKTKTVSYSSVSPIQNTAKINGVSMVSISTPIDSTAFIPVANINANWVANIPFGFIPNNSSTVQYNEDWQWYGEKTEGIIESIKLAKEQGLKVLLKPHLWIHHVWVGDLNFNTEKEWGNFESSYSNFILHYAQLADSMNVEAYCIGVELRKISTKNITFWNNLIDSVRHIYSGKITYAANWDNYENIPFWNKLDFIGIDAYFPVSDKKTPSVKECFEGWNPNFEKIKALSEKLNKKVVFTEFGYRNVDFTGKKPWDDTQLNTYNTESQNNAYQAIFDKFWGESWFEGGFLWKWYPHHNNEGGIKSNRFSPQNKPAEKIISTFYKTQS